MPDDPAPAESKPAQPERLSPQQRLERCEKAVDFFANYMFSADELLRELVARVAALETRLTAELQRIGRLEDGVQGMLDAGDKLREVIEKATPPEDDADSWKTGDHDG